LTPSATYGPVTVASAHLQISTLKWIQIYNFTETVEFVRAGTVLCVVPISIFHFGSPTHANIVSGSAWIAVNPFDATAPAGSFAGIAIQSGAVSCDQPMSFAAAVVNVPVGATLDLTLVPAPSPAGPAGFPAQVTAPARITISFPPSGSPAISPTISYDSCSATLYGENVGCTPNNQKPAYNATLKLLYIPGLSSAASFTPTSVAGKLIALNGSAPIVSAGWALSVSESTTPATLGTASGSGDFAIVFGAGLSSQWTGLSRPESAAGGTLIAQNAALLLYLISGSAPGVVLEQ
jgi:hypothetical protein